MTHDIPLLQDPGCLSPILLGSIPLFFLLHLLTANGENLVVVKMLTGSQR